MLFQQLDTIKIGCQKSENHAEQSANVNQHCFTSALVNFFRTVSSKPPIDSRVNNAPCNNVQKVSGKLWFWRGENLQKFKTFSQHTTKTTKTQFKTIFTPFVQQH
jgi:hypothetical protein